MPNSRYSFLPELRDADLSGDAGLSAAGGHAPDRRDGAVYVLDDQLRMAVDVALATGRPLLLRGEPGSGKSSLAGFIARNLNWRYYEHVVSSRTTAQDLLWSFDSMRRLADASALRGAGESADLDNAGYLEPGVMWWALNRKSALTRGRSASSIPPRADVSAEPFPDLNAERDTEHSVVLIDEIDKADPDVPNGLLVPLGSTEFMVTPIRFLVRQQPSGDDQPHHLIVITTNEERELPPAFLRRCIVHTLLVPDRETLLAIARRHLTIGGSELTDQNEELLRQLADKFFSLRGEAQKRGERPPSTAEYLDALRVCLRLGVRVGDQTWDLVRTAGLGQDPAPARAGRAVSDPAGRGSRSDDPPATAGTDVWLGDLIRAWHTLAVDGEQARQVASLMGFGLPKSAGTASYLAPRLGSLTSPAEGAAPPRLGPQTGAAPTSARSRPEPAPAQPGFPAPAQSLTFRRHLRPAGVDVGLRAQQGTDAPGDADLLPPGPAQRSVPLTLRPLLPARVTSGILTASIATDAGDGMPDVDALVELVAQRRFDEAIPRLVRASLFRGVQLLLDRSPAMTPFARDVTELARLVRSVVGHHVEEISFSGSPQDRLPREGPPYELPRPGTPVLALSDLGIAHPQGYLRPDARATWRPLAELLLRRGSYLVAFVPYPRPRWPALGDCIQMIPWDTTTSPADVTRAVGRILGGPRGRY